MSPQRRMFDKLVRAEPAALPVDILSKALWEITSGNSAFGPLTEWDEWFHYLLPRLLSRAFEDDCGSPLFEYLASACLALHPFGVRELRPGRGREHVDLASDLVETMGRMVMSAEWWSDASDFSETRWGSFEVDCIFSASAVLCWKYLAPERIDGWLESVFGIREPHWQARWMLWLLGARPFLMGEQTRPRALEHTDPPIGWNWNYLLGKSIGPDGEWSTPELIPAANRSAFADSLRQRLTPELFLEWVDDFAAAGLLAGPLACYPDQFAEELVYSGVPPLHGVVNRP